MTRVVNVAFQGGGARFITLIAAADAINGLQNDGKIAVKAVAGSSAGSLAAFLLTQNIKYDDLKKAIRRKDKEIRKSFPRFGKFRGWLSVLWFMLTGRTVYDVRKFDELLEDIFRELGLDVRRSLSDLESDIKLHIMISDVYQARSAPCHAGDTLRHALRASCAIPVVFASYARDDHGQQVDGGVFDNLPTEILAESAGGTPVFAIGFSPRPIRSAKSSSGYLFALISSMISQRETRSRAIVGVKNVLPLETALDTFDFHDIVGVGLDEEYDHVKEQTRNFFLGWLNGAHSDADQQRFTAPIKLRDTETRLVAFIEESWRHAVGINRYVRFKVDAHCLLQANSPDQLFVEQLSEIPPGKVVPGIILPLVNGDGARSRTECHVRVDGPEGESVPFTEFIVERHIGDGRKRDDVVLLINDDLTKYSGKSLYILKKETRYGFMAPLRDAGHDVLSVRSGYWNAEEVSIQLNVPVEFGPVEAVWEGFGEAGAPVARRPPDREFNAGMTPIFAVSRPSPRDSGIRLLLRRAGSNK